MPTAERIGEATVDAGHVGHRAGDLLRAIGEKVVPGWSRSSPRGMTCLSMTLATPSPSGPAAKIVTSTTSARPTISAAAVTAVRCGWRIAFSRASTPVRPWKRASGAPSTRASGRTSSGAEERDAEHHQHRAEAEQRGARADPTMPPKSPKKQRDEAEAQQRDRADDRRRRRCPTPGVTLVAHRRHGLDARRAAGRHEAGDHRRDQADDEADDHRGGLDHQPGRPEVDAERLQHRRRPGASTMPDEHAEDRRDQPTTNVSISTERRTCAREAPSTRSSANSFVRCATVTVNVLKIRKPPTSSATAAKTSSAVRMKPSASERSCACCSAASLPGADVEVLCRALLQRRP